MSDDRPLVGKALRKKVLEYLASGRITYSDPHAIERMKQRKVTAAQVEAAMKSGALLYDSTVYGRHRYLAVKGKLHVAFTFEAGLIVITVILKG